MADRFASYSVAPVSPGTKIAQVTSGVDLAAGPCRALLVGTAGKATVVDLEGNTSTDIPLQQGWNPIRVSKVTFSGTGAAADIWAIY